MKTTPKSDGLLTELAMGYSGQERQPDEAEYGIWHVTERREGRGR